ncbi:hypothetical protein [Variovorax paradoxus]|uniref:hypothetical protein n=1 Tax=Variovorax paradoxus TaxID=34073 RepID=UPI0029C85B57|nr:hypothetical protein RZE77_19795 [Variovorax paradoxus]
MPIDWLQIAQASGRYLVDNPTIIAAAIAGVVAIVATRTTLHGVELSLGSSEAKTKAELAHSVDQENRNREHTRTEAAKERELDAQKDRHGRLVAMRREVYLAAVGEMVKFQTFLGAVTEKEIADLDLRSEIGNLSLAVYRVSIVAEQHTAELARETLNVYGSLLMRSLAKVIPLAGLRATAKVHNDLYRQARERADSYVELMRQFNLSQRVDQDEFGSIRKQFDASQEEANRHTSQAASAQAQLAAMQLDIAQFLMTALKEEVTDKLDRLLVAMRDELELSSDLDAFRRLSLITFEQVQSAMAEVKAAVRDLSQH